MTYWATNTATIWEVSGRDAYGQATFGTPYTIDATWKVGGDAQRDNDGVEFVPSSVFYTTSVLQRGWYIAKGDQTGTADPSNASGEIIRKISEFDMSQFNADTEYAVMT